MYHERPLILNMNAAEILTEALIRITETTGLATRILDLKEEKYYQTDAVIELGEDKYASIWEAEVKTEIRTSKLAQVIDHQNLTNTKIILIARYIPSPMKAELRTKKISYIETSGNCYIESRNLFVFVNNQKTIQPRQTDENKLWAPAGLKFLFAILVDPSLLNESYRKMAYTSGVALGNIGSFITELKRDNLIVDGSRHGQQVLLLNDKNSLLDKWADMYRTILRPKQMVGRFRFLKKEDRANWQEYTDSMANSYWGGEAAGAILTGYLLPEIYTLYSDIDRFALMKMLKVVPDVKGELELLRPFWNQDIYTAHLGTVPPILAYAELISSYDSRNQETAGRIKEKYVR